MKLTPFKRDSLAAIGLGWVVYMAGCGLASVIPKTGLPFTPWHPWWALTALVGTAVVILTGVVIAEPRIDGLTTDEQDLLDTYRKNHTS